MTTIGPDSGTIAVTTGTLDDPRLVCVVHRPAVILGEFTRDDLEPGERCRECGATLGEARYDGVAINGRWGNAWPGSVSDPTDRAHEFSPVLQAPVANLLGEPWYLEAESPGGDFVTWLDLAGGGRVAVSPHLVPDQGMRWIIGLMDDRGRSVHQDHDLAITEPAETVAGRVRILLRRWEVAGSCF